MNFEITYWYGPQTVNAPWYLKNIKDAGSTLALAEEDIESNKACLKDFAEYGPEKATVYDFRIGKALEEGADSKGWIWEFCEDYREYPAFIASISSTSLILQNLKTGWNCPYHKEGRTWQGKQYQSFPKLCLSWSSWEMKHMKNINNQFVEIVQLPILSYDHYHFLKVTPSPRPWNTVLSSRAGKADLSRPQTCNRGGFFANSEIIRKAALKANIPLCWLSFWWSMEVIATSPAPKS